LYWLALRNVSNLGIQKSRILLEVFLTPQKIFEASPSDLKAIKGIGDVIVRSLGEKERLISEAERELIRLKEREISIITLLDPFYPELLKEISDPPLVLFLKGSFSSQDKNSIAVIGTRTPDYYGRTVASQLCSKIIACNFTIVSGMARGIDTIAHRTAIKSGGRTIAVMGCGLDIAYPPENLKLMEDISVHGAVISEFPLGTEPQSCNFPKRNRIISGLSRGVLVVQAREKSGTIHTVNAALEQGREVYAVPGPIDKELSRGTNYLIKEGAKLVEDIQDIMEELVLSTDVPSGEKSVIPEMAGSEKEIYSFISMEPIHIDEIIRKTSMDTGKVLGILSILEVHGLIRRIEGNFFVRF